MNVKLIGGSRAAWSDFANRASAAERRAAYIALLDAVPGVFGERLRHAYKVGGVLEVRGILLRRRIRRSRWRSE